MDMALSEDGVVVAGSVTDEHHALDEGLIVQVSNMG